MQKIRKLSRLSLSDQVLLVRTAILILSVRAALSLFSFRAVRVHLARIGKPAQASAFDTKTASVQKLLWAVDLTSSYLLPDRPCLTKALVAQMLLSRSGYQTTLRIGVAHSSIASLQAHAWLERNGEIVIGRLKDLERFIPLPPLELDRV